MNRLSKAPRGFTLIELLVVVAIIGILSAAVLASLSIARGRAGDAKVKNLSSNLRTGMELYYAAHSSSYGSYGSGPVSGTCPVASSPTPTSAFPDAVSGTYNIIRSLKTVPGVSITACYANGSIWAVGVQLPSDPSNAYWCVDSKGAAKEVAATLATNSIGSTLCP